MLIHSILSNESWAKMNIFFKCIKKIRERVVWENIWTDSCLSRHFIRSLAEPLLTPGRRDKTTVRSGVEDRGGGKGVEGGVLAYVPLSATTATHFDCQQQFAFGLTIVRLWSFFASALCLSDQEREGDGSGPRSLEGGGALQSSCPLHFLTVIKCAPLDSIWMPLGTVFAHSQDVERERQFA